MELLLESRIQPLCFLPDSRNSPRGGGADHRRLRISPIGFSRFGLPPTQHACPRTWSRRLRDSNPFRRPPRRPAMPRKETTCVFYSNAAIPVCPFAVGDLFPFGTSHPSDRPSTSISYHRIRRARRATVFHHGRKITWRLPVPATSCTWTLV